MKKLLQILMKELSINEDIIKDESKKEWLLIILAVTVVIAGIVIRVFAKDDFGVSMLLAGAFSLLSYFAGRKSSFKK